MTIRIAHVTERFFHSFNMFVAFKQVQRMDYLLERRFCKKITVSVHFTILTVYRKCSGVWKSSTIDICGAFCTMSYTDKLYECDIKNAILKIKETLDKLPNGYYNIK